MDMNINTNTIRGRSNSSNKVSSRELSTHSNASTTPYYEKIEIQNNFLDEDIQKQIKSPQLFYVLVVEKTTALVSKATNKSPQNETPC